ncbi:MAG TPA: hypothetical protein VF008_12580 [Niastella sp.]
MKKLLTVISGVLLCAFVFSGFTTPRSTNFTTTNIASKENTRGTAPQFYRSKWQHTAWVNPWMQTKPTQKKSLTDPTIDINADFFWRPDVYICRLINTQEGTIFDGLVNPNQLIRTVPAGSYLTFEMQISQPNGNFIISIQDHYPGAIPSLFYQDTGFYAVFTWEAVAGHWYTIDIR